MGKFKVGDKARCTCQGIWNSLTVNKVYSVENATSKEILITDDDGDGFYFNEELFELVGSVPKPDLDTKIKELERQLSILKQARDLLK